MLALLRQRRRLLPYSGSYSIRDPKEECGDVVLLRAEHKEEEHDEDDGKADKKRGVDDLLHSEDDDLCF